MIAIGMRITIATPHAGRLNFEQLEVQVFFKLEQHKFDEPQSLSESHTFSQLRLHLFIFVQQDSPTPH